MARLRNHPLYHWRAQNGHMPLEAVASKVGCSQAHLSEIENGNNKPSLALAFRLHKMTGIDLADFVLTKTDEPSEPNEVA
jgi:transcriptional regulator with XRE-family HTH domain